MPQSTPDAHSRAVPIGTVVISCAWFLKVNKTEVCFSVTRTTFQVFKSRTWPAAALLDDADHTLPPLKVSRTRLI